MAAERSNASKDEFSLSSVRQQFVAPSNVALRSDVWELPSDGLLFSNSNRATVF